MIFCAEDYWVGLCTGFGWGVMLAGLLAGVICTMRSSR